MENLDLNGTYFVKAETAGPGFMNFFLGSAFYSDVLTEVLTKRQRIRQKRLRQPPQGHGRVRFRQPHGSHAHGQRPRRRAGRLSGAVLDWSGYDVTREFYINDAGNQIQKFGKSLAVRYLQQFCGEEAYPLPKECYQGGDIKVLAGEFAELNGDKYVAACKGMDEEALFESEAFAALKDALVAYALPKNIAALKRDLGKYRIDYDVWFHESTLHESGAVLAV